jgi:ectoine hydroxylase
MIMAKGVIADELIATYERGRLHPRSRACSTPKRLAFSHEHRAEDRVLISTPSAKATAKAARFAFRLWNHPTDTIYGMIARSESIVGTAEKLLGDEVYHYHSKMIMKDAKVGGAWAWHQDYGYWYQNGVLFPASHQRLHRGRSRYKGERLSAGHPRITQAWAASSMY